MLCLPTLQINSLFWRGGPGQIEFCLQLDLLTLNYELCPDLCLWHLCVRVYVHPDNGDLVALHSGTVVETRGSCNPGLTRLLYCLLNYIITHEDVVWETMCSQIRCQTGKPRAHVTWLLHCSSVLVQSHVCPPSLNKSALIFVTNFVLKMWFSCDLWRNSSSWLISLFRTFRLIRIAPLLTSIIGVQSWEIIQLTLINTLNILQSARKIKHVLWLPRSMFTRTLQARLLSGSS